MSVAAVLRKITAHLEQSAISYMLVGSFASSFHGALRSTRDVDFVIEATPSQLHGLIAYLQADNYYAELDAALDALKHESLFNVIDHATGWKIDLIFRQSRPFDQEEFRRRVPAMSSFPNSNGRSWEHPRGKSRTRQRSWPHSGRRSISPICQNGLRICKSKNNGPPRRTSRTPPINAKLIPCVATSKSSSTSNLPLPTTRFAPRRFSSSAKSAALLSLRNRTRQLS